MKSLAALAFGLAIGASIVNAMQSVRISRLEDRVTSLERMPVGPIEELDLQTPEN